MPKDPMDERPPWTIRRSPGKVLTDTVRDFGLVVGALGLIVGGTLVTMLVSAALAIAFGLLLGLIFFVGILVAIGVFVLAREFG